MKMRILLTLTALVLAVCGSASATPMLFFADLTGAQEVPPVDTIARGFSTLFLDDDANTVVVSLLFAGLTSPQTAAHIHGPALPGVNAAIFLPLPTGSFLDQQFTITEEQAGWIKSGLAYVNVHTDNNLGGEIRGQYAEAIPEPGTIALVASGIGLAFFARRKRR